ncbi:GFA family protein [Variovorax sp. GT1P44]|uniref:GFA family protein n=1 Tax=Variovorax sp. GT1P44 TaxID=3443742 RepID=UPI003F47D99B
MVVRGACHCGNISFALTWEPEPSEIPARACDCSFCSKHGGVWTSNPAGALRVRVEDPSLLSKYSFGTGTAQFHICARCGVPALVTSTVDEHLYAVVNVNTFENVPQSLLRAVPVSFDGESIESRLSRRKRNWIADVQFVGAVD